MTPVEDMKLMHWGKSKINLGLGKRKNPHIQTGLMGTGLCLGHSGSGAKRIKPCRAS